MTRFAAAALALALLGGCANQLLSDDRIRTSTAQALGQSPASIQISDRLYDGATNTSYTARTPRGTYHCLINGGSIMAMGMTNPAQCAPAGQPLPSGMPFGR